MDKSALIIVDLQNDFISGSLCVKNYGDLTNRINSFQKNFKYVIYTKDNHPIDHISFLTEQEDKNIYIDQDIITKKFARCFPVHCVVNTWGNQLDKDLMISENSIITLKGENKYKEEFSGFSNSELNSYLLKYQIKDVYVCGLVYEYCVGSTCVDSSILGYNTYLVKDLIISLNDNNNDNDKNENIEDNGTVVFNQNNIEKDKDLELIKCLGSIRNMKSLLEHLNVKEINSFTIEL